MARVTSKPKRVFVFMLMLVMLLTGFGSVGNASATNDDSETMELPDSMVRTDLSDIKDELSSTSYSDYLNVNSYSQDKNVTEEIVINMATCLDEKNHDATVEYFENAKDFRRLYGVGDAKIVPAQGLEIHLNPYTPL